MTAKLGATLLPIFAGCKSVLILAFSQELKLIVYLTVTDYQDHL